ncbi:Short-chain dehydrogenase/reductase family protein [Mycena venus]|uniref:Short-chain dehydrogenase/reductase family protein n=1 Tax=Mycena venus TaxID=2733690 RepID=A0A8H6Y555_9AGAR|nr:Short-chain dehydrogenase/reductase family protein [Mycena venus]
MLRTALLGVICLTVPAFGVYTALLEPIQSETMTRKIKVSHSWRKDVNRWIGPAENITIIFSLPPPPASTNITMERCGNLVLLRPSEIVVFSSSGTRRDSYGTTSTIVCPFDWPTYPSPDDVVITANFSDATRILSVKPGQGAEADVDEYTEPIPLSYGETAVFTKLTRFSWIHNVYNTLLVQTDPFPPNNGSDMVSLRLRLRDDFPGASKMVQDYTDVSVLSGLAALGGLWTFTNGVFALLFGANLLYFLFGKRPLSALGIVHVFQRTTLIRNWHEDFPALYSEGGSPGSDSAGVVAFIRERLIDVKVPAGTPDTQDVSLETLYRPVDDMPSDYNTSRGHSTDGEAPQERDVSPETLK